MNDKFEIGKSSNGDPVVVVVDEASFVFQETSRTSSGKTSYRDLVEKVFRAGRKDKRDDVRIGPDVVVNRWGEPEYPEPGTLSRADVVRALVELLDQSGWQRLEVYRKPFAPRANGYCIDAEGNHLHVSDLL